MGDNGVLRVIYGRVLCWLPCIEVRGFRGARDGIWWVGFNFLERGRMRGGKELKVRPFWDVAVVLPEMEKRV